MRKPPKPADVDYRVKLDAETGKWEIWRDGIKTGGFARDMHTAIGLATRDAQREVMATDLKVIVTTMKDGVLTVEWRGP